MQLGNSNKRDPHTPQLDPKAVSLLEPQLHRCRKQGNLRGWSILRDTEHAMTVRLSSHHSCLETCKNNRERVTALTLQQQSETQRHNTPASAAGAQLTWLPLYPLPPYVTFKGPETENCFSLLRYSGHLCSRSPPQSHPGMCTAQWVS